MKSNSSMSPLLLSFLTIIISISIALSVVIKGKGSAIFFYLSNESTSGCVVISEKKMKEILGWLSPQKHPCILMGNKEVLRKDYKKTDTLQQFAFIFVLFNDH
ncbi:MAG: hypothetical protein QM751_16030 [Paludibacteraceae bacterium]